MPSKVRIVRAPIGEAPEWVREAWVGVELPVLTARKLTTTTFGALTGPTTLLASIWALARGKATKVTGYAVRSAAAIELLAASDPDAAAWWRENAPVFAKGRRIFLFDAPACELIWEPPTAH